jgi:CRISPR-associated protein Csc2
MTNHIIGIVLCDGEIFSNLHLTQALYDALKPDINAPIADIITKATEVTNSLLNQEPVRKKQVITGSQLTNLLTEVSAIYQDETLLQQTISSLYQQTKTYAETYGAVAKKAKK